MELMEAALAILLLIIVVCIYQYIDRNVIRPLIAYGIVNLLEIDEIDFFKADGVTRIRLLEEKYRTNAELLMRRATRITNKLAESDLLDALHRKKIVDGLDNALYKLRTGEVSLVAFDNTRAVPDESLRTLVDAYNTDAHTLRHVSRQLRWLVPQIFFGAWLYTETITPKEPR